MTRGQRNNNPLNIRRSSDRWVGMAPQQTDPDFVVFSDIFYGIRAAIIIIRNYYKKHHLCTIQEIISRWAPLSENDTQRYVKYICNKMGENQLTPLQMNDPETIARLICAMAKFESNTDLNVKLVTCTARDLFW